MWCNFLKKGYTLRTACTANKSPVFKPIMRKRHCLSILIKSLVLYKRSNGATCSEARPDYYCCAKCVLFKKIIIAADVHSSESSSHSSCLTILRVTFSPVMTDFSALSNSFHFNEKVKLFPVPTWYASRWAVEEAGKRGYF